LLDAAAVSCTYFAAQASGCFCLMNRLMLWWVHRHVASCMHLLTGDCNTLTLLLLPAVLQAFGCFYLMNRLMLWWVHRHVEGGSQEMWRGSQMWVWISPNHIKAIWKVLVAENWLFKKLFAFEVRRCTAALRM
jgi:hypothetical protein